MQNKKFILLILLLIFLLSSCNKKTDKNIENKNTSVNYLERNRVFEKYLFREKIISNVSLMKKDFTEILDSEKVQINENEDNPDNNFKIKSINKINYEYKFGKKLEDGLKKFSLMYNKNGKLIERQIYNFPRDSHFDYKEAKIKYTYNLDTIISKVSAFNFFDNLIYNIDFTYDKNNLLISKSKKSEYIESSEPVSDKFKKNKYYKRLEIIPFLGIDKKDFYIVFKYDSLGKRIEMVDWKSDGRRVNKKEIYTYDSLGNIKEAVIFDIWNYSLDKLQKNKIIKFNDKDFEIIYLDDKDSVKFKINYEYDNNFNPLEISQFNNQNSLDWKSIINYDEHGNQIEKILYNWDLSIDKKIELSFNENNKLVNKKIIRGSDELVYQINYSYNDSALISEEIILNNKNEQVSKTTFKYDERKNIIEAIEYDNLNEPIKATNFIYEYYE